MKLYQIVSCDLPAEYTNHTLFTCKKQALSLMKKVFDSGDSCGDNLQVVEYNIDLDAIEPQQFYPIPVHNP